MISILIKPNGETLQVSPTNRRDFTLEELHSLVGCETVEIVSIASGHLMAVDEDGIAKGLEINPIATAMYQENRMTFKEAEEHYAQTCPGFVVVIGGNQEGNIYGNALVCDKSMIK